MYVTMLTISIISNVIKRNFHVLTFKHGRKTVETR